MATNYNRFGATYDQVIDLFPGAVTTDFATDSKTGDTIINAVLDRVSRDIMRAMPPAMRDGMFQVNAEQCVRYATQGQTTFSVGMKPVLSGTMHLWRYPTQASLEIPIPLNIAGVGSGVFASDYAFRRPVKGLLELASTDYSVTYSTGAILLGGTISAGLNLGERIYASYDVDVDNAAFSMPSLADVLCYGAGAEVGSKLYSEGTAQWALVKDYRERYAGIVTAIAAGEWVPDELRRLRYWEDLQPKNSEIKSARIHRA